MRTLDLKVLRDALHLKGQLLAVTVLVGLLLAAAGMVEIVFAFKSDSFGKGVLVFLFGGLGLLAGLVALVTPVASLAVLTIVLAGLFFIGGVVDIVLAVRLRPEEGWGWMLLSGIVSIALGALIANSDSVKVCSPGPCPEN